MIPVADVAISRLLFLRYFLLGRNPIAVSLDGQLLASTSEDGVVCLWDSENGEQVQELEGHSDPVCCLAFSPDGRLLASESSDRTIALWNLEIGDIIRKFEGHNGPRPIVSIPFSPNGQVLASASWGPTIRR